ncbi:MAG: hypothetical protein HYV97_01130 [Bdellovibrio sp.]|nr:hypothetical protein [Bdellovibrio sp.]
MDSDTGPSSEQQYHEQARKEFERILVLYRTKIEANIAILRHEFGEKAQIVGYNQGHRLLNEFELGPSVGSKPTGPCRMSFPIFFPDMGQLEISFGAPLTKALYQAIAERTKALFSEERMRPGTLKN